VPSSRDRFAAESFLQGVEMLTTVLTPTERRLLIAGHDPVKEALLVRRAFGIVFQDPSLDGELAAAENMELHGVLYRVPRAERRARVEALLCSDTSSRKLVISVPVRPKETTHPQVGPGVRIRFPPAASLSQR
jgi:ABC-type ATPase involved in cell division